MPESQRTLNLMNSVSPSLSVQTPAVQQPTVTRALTRQHKLWRAEYDAHLAAKLSGQAGLPKEPPHRFVLTDPLLRSLLFFQPPTEGMPQLYSWTNGKALGAALLTWFVQRALGLRRLPFCEDRLLTRAGLRSDEDALLAILQELTPQRVNNITDEVARLYEHTQAQLRAKGLSVVQVRRHIDEYQQDEFQGYGSILRQQRGQAGQFALLKMAAQALGRTTIDIDMDTLNSWGDDGGYAHRAIHLNASIPISDILCATELVAAGGGMESGEWIVINRSLTGVVSVPTDSVDVCQRALDADAFKEFFQRLDPEEIFREYQPLTLRSSLNVGKSTLCQPRPQLPTSLAYRLMQAWRYIRSGHM